MIEALDPLAEELRRELGDAIVSIERGAESSEICMLVRSEQVAAVAATLRSRFRYTRLVDLCAADYPEREQRFEVVYHLYSFRENRRIRLKTRAGDGSPVPSVTGVWRGAGWPEREVHDLFGIDFTGHPDLTRILLWEGFTGHPLRKDFPLAGIDTGAALHLDPPDMPGASPAAGDGTAPAARPEATAEGDAR
ncbi:MAG TPA: NADH-quinone oxidoreductase subunit C [Thermoanaerobaculia bacterium]|nr:NADH-quinone oxidoreductase subunit C [Thermoanaerobaculia bacterium]